jgi:hypothetical protein
MPDTIFMTVGMSTTSSNKGSFYLKELVLLESDQEAIEVHSIPAVSDGSFFFLMKDLQDVSLPGMLEPFQLLNPKICSTKI